MGSDFIKDILRQAADMGCLTVRFTGGEPLLREDFPELYLFARRLGMFVILFTNARLITPEIAQLLSKYPPGREVEVSVYGMHPKSYDKVALRKGAFLEFWRGLELLQEYKIPFIVKQSLLPQNRNEMSEFEALAETIPAMHSMPSYTMNFDLRARRDNPQKNEFIQQLRLTPEETVQTLDRYPNYRKDMQDFAGKFMRPPGDILFSCGAGLGTCIDAYGKAQMCLLLRHPDTVYQLKTKIKDSENFSDQDEGSLHYAMTEFFPKLRKIRATNPSYLSRCAICFLKGLCEQCPAKSWMEHGTLDTPVEYLCSVAHAQARYLGLITKTENAWELIPSVWQERIDRFVSSADVEKQG